MKIFVPGRICLFGEHSDWAGGYRRINANIEKGYTLITGTDQGIYAEVKPHPSSLVLTSTKVDEKDPISIELPMNQKDLLEVAQDGGYWSYIAGTAYQILTHYHVRGLEINNYKTDLPIKKGLSSSAAICVLTARAFNRVYDLKMTIRGEMEMAYLGEITTPSRCGRMDQGCAYGNRPILMTFDGDHLDVSELQAPKPLHYVIVDLQAKKSTMDILASLNRSFPFAADEVETGVQKLLGPINKRIVNQAVDFLQKGNLDELGTLMVDAQEIFDKYAIPACPQELTAPTLHKLITYKPLKSHIFGAKGVGSQGDGTAQLLARSKKDQQTIIEIIEHDLNLTCLPLTIRTGQQVRKAVIPAAGFGTRLFPASKATKKELFPIIDRDGIAKPAILLIVEEALNAGIEEIIIIVQENDLEAFQSFFNIQVTIENFNKLPPKSKEYAQRLLEIGRHIKFVIQDTQQGFGHAVYRAHELVGNEPFLLMLGDHIYRSDGEHSCASQLINTFNKYGVSVLGVRNTPEDMIANFGTIAGEWLEDKEGQILNITNFVEKPTIEFAQNNLLIENLPGGYYLTVFGQYIIKPQIFDYLEEHIQQNVREHGEIQLTSALDRLRKEDGFLGLVINGQRYDIGLPEYYLETLERFSKKE